MGWSTRDLARFFSSVIMSPPCRQVREKIRWWKQQQLVAQERLVDGAKDLVGDVAGETHTRDFGAKFRGERAYRKGPAQIGGRVHGYRLPGTVTWDKYTPPRSDS